MFKKSMIVISLLAITIVGPAKANPVLSANTPKHFYQLPSFDFVDALSGKSVANPQLKGHITIASFFFTSCTHVCPFIMGNMAKLQKKYANADDVKLMSITTDPKKDSIDVLKKYSKKFSANSGKWWFITGKAEEIVRIANDGFKLAISLEMPEIHSEKFVLIDENGWIRAYFNSSSKEDMEQLDSTIKLLRQELKGKS